MADTTPRYTLRDLDRFLQNVDGARTEELPLVELLEREARALLAAHRAGHPAAPCLIRGGEHRPGKSKTDAELLAEPMSEEQARKRIAQFHWFRDWADATRNGQQLVNPRFEAACDAIVAGDAEALRKLVAAEPSLVRARSAFKHQATLLLHVAANGIEHTRQWQSPKNAAEIAQILLEAGAEPDATCECYGGEWTTMDLLVTSGHPAGAGVQADVVETLVRGGANPNGPRDDGSPLWCALTYWYTPAVDRLVTCGARLDNLVFAAAAGDLAAVESYFDESGRLVPERAHSWGKALAWQWIWGSKGKHLDPRHMLEYALNYAAVHGRKAVVELLLGKGPDLGVVEPIWNNTLLDAIEYRAQHPEILALIKPLFEQGGERPPA
jgi:hypothetical protein